MSSSGRQRRFSPPPESAGGTLLSVRDLTLRFRTSYGDVGVLDRVGFTVQAGERIGIIGESGCGKSLLGLSIIGLLSPAAAASGSIVLQGQELLGLGERAWKRVRGNTIAMVYQDALTSLNPGLRIGTQMSYVCRGDSFPMDELLEMVALQDVHGISDAYPHQLSGGQRQRVLIAMALARRPALLIADEPTTALDVTVEAQVIALLRDLQAQLGFALLFVSHDLALVARVATRVIVMYAGQICEVSTPEALFSAPAHPYAAGLVAASMSLEQGRTPLAQIPGTVPEPTRFSPGCRFSDRCGRMTDICVSAPPELRSVNDRVRVACYHPHERAVSERL